MQVLKNKRLKKRKFFISILLLSCGWLWNVPAFGQTLNDVKITVTYSSAPTTVQAKTAFLKYNKSFVLVLQADDATTDVYDSVYPFFAGLKGYPGLFFTDGAGNNVPFSLEVNHFSLKSGVYVHNTDTSHYLSWRKINDLWQNGYSIDNRGFVDPPYGSEQDYQVQRNISFTTKETAPFTKGGITMDTYVLPANGQDQMVPARDNAGYIGFFSNPSFDLNTNPIDLVSVRPLFPGRLFLRNRIDKNLYNNTRVMDLQSINGHHFMGVYDFRKFGVSPDISFAVFQSQMKQIAAAFGKNGKDNIWVAGDQEVFEYLLLKEKVSVLKSTLGNSTQISFVGNQIPTHLHWYSLTVLVVGDQPVTGIQVQGATASTHAFHGDTALINFSWNGRVIVPEGEMANHYIQLAKNDSSAANCLIASDYVDAIQNPDTLKKYHDELCALNTSSLKVYCSYHFTVPGDTVCLGDTAMLTAPAGMTHYLWNTGDTTQSIRVAPKENTRYWVKITTPDGQTGTDTTGVIVNPVPVFEHSPDTVVIQPGTDTLLWASGGYPSYLWNTGATDTSIVVSAKKNTTYWVKVTSDKGCSTTQNFLVAPDYHYKTDFVYDTVCFGDSTRLINISTGKDSLLQVSWDLNMDGKYTDAYGDTVLYAFPKPQLWVVGMRLSYKSGNILLKVHQVPVGGKPQVDFSYTGQCTSEGNTFFVDSTKVAYGEITTRYWDYGDGRSEFRPNIYAYHQYYPGNYTAKLIVTTSFGCTDSLSQSFSIYGSPDITLLRQDGSQVYYNDTVSFKEGDSAYVYVKNPADYDSIIWPPHILSPDFYVKTPGEYTVKAYVNICPGTTVFYGKYAGGGGGGGGENPPVTTAPAMPFFTPNGDGINDEWKVDNKKVASPFQLRIYNRAGSLVYSSDNYNNDWKGEFNGNPLPKGTYYYVIVDAAGKKYTGTISIIR
jgi:gliding motility-associated-like protein